MTSIPQLAETLFTTLTTTATTLARELGLVQRERAMDGGQFVRTLVLGWFEQPTASRRALTTMAHDHGVSITPSGLQAWLTDPASLTLFERLFQTILATPILGAPTPAALLERFAGVWLHDSTTITLPPSMAERFPGCGGQRNGKPVGQAGIKAQVRLDMTTGELHGPIIQAARGSDRAVAFRTRLPKGSVQIRDLGYFNLEELAREHADGRWWITRLKPQTAIWVDGERRDLATWLPTLPGHAQAWEATIGSAQRIPCRLVVVPVAAPVAEQRRRQLRQTCQRKGRTPSAQALALCDWLITVTNIPADQATIDEIVVLLRLRWQIELLFKVWKGDSGITLTAAQDVTAVQVELYAKWCGLILAHWVAIVGAWHMLGWSMMTALTIIRRSIRDLNRAIQAGADLTVVLQEMATALQRERLQRRGDDRLNHAELLAHPAALGLADALAAADLAHADAADA